MQIYDALNLFFFGILSLLLNYSKVKCLSGIIVKKKNRT